MSIVIPPAIIMYGSRPCSYPPVQFSVITWNTTIATYTQRRPAQTRSHVGEDDQQRHQPDEGEDTEGARRE